MDASWIPLTLIAVIAVLTLTRRLRKRRRKTPKPGGVMPRHGDGGGAGGDNGP